jgi:hypothetical protein
MKPGDNASVEALRMAVARIAALEGALRLHNLTPTGKVRKCLPGCIACALLRPEQNSYLIDQDFDE